MSDIAAKILALNGGKVVDLASGALTAQRSSGYIYLRVREDATRITVLTDGNQTPGDMVAQHNISGRDLIAGEIYAPINGGIIDAITVTAGSVQLIKG